MTFTTLFPNPAQPVNGIFVENRLRHLIDSRQVEARVVAPVPWFPMSNPRFGKWAKFSNVPLYEERHGIRIWHPRFPVIPKVGMSAAPSLMYLWTRGLMHRLKAEEDFDLIDAHYFYPDGVCAALIARELDLPLVITARGTDLNLIPRFALPRAQIRWAAGLAKGLITVCDALKQPLLDLGIPTEKIRSLRNGVDLKTFKLLDRTTARAQLAVTGQVLVSVGLLIERKGHHLIIDALRQLPNSTLLIVGGGPDLSALEAQARSAGVEGRVRFLGEVPHQFLPMIYSAADALILASSREGWANVLLESMACGTPVIASDVWGTKEVVCTKAAGVLMKERSAKGVVEGVHALFANRIDRLATRHHAEHFSWDATTQGQLALFNQIIANHPHHQPSPQTISA